LGVEGQAPKDLARSAGRTFCIEPENSTQLVEAILRLAADANSGKSWAATDAAHFAALLAPAGRRSVYRILNSLLGNRRLAQGA